MMTLVGKLCALCAVCALMQMMLGDTRQSESLRLIGGLLMLHLVFSGARELWYALCGADGLMALYKTLIG